MTSGPVSAMVAATADYLYVGFDSPSGARIMRTSNPSATSQADFERDYGGVGLGNVANTRILDGKALTAGGVTAVWLTVAGSGALTTARSSVLAWPRPPRDGG